MSAIRALLEAVTRPADPRAGAALLDRFAATGGEATFGELLRRHGPWVSGLAI